MLIDNLQHNLKYLHDCEIVIVNDDPSKSIKNELIKFPVKLLQNKKNLGFSGAVNRGFEHTTGEFVLLLNTDVMLRDAHWMRAVDKLKNDEQLFAVSFAQKEQDGRTVGKNRIYWKSGFFLHEKAPDLTEGINGWAEGGSCIIRKTYFEDLGGFDEIFSPFYWEDIDLSYRAWKSDYTILFDPLIHVDHHHESTIGKYFKKKNVERISYRNQFIFIWKNMDTNLLRSHLLRLPLFLLVVIVQWPAVLGFFSALVRLPAIMQRRNNQKMGFKKRDEEILSQFRA